MKDVTNEREKVLSNIIIVILIFLFLSLIFSYFSKYSVKRYASHNIDDNFLMEFYEDTSKLLSIQDVKAKRFEFTKFESYLNFGNSKSNIWVKITAKKNINNDEKYISVYNPTVEKVVLYAPIRECDGSIKFETIFSGWYYSEISNDEGFLYPVIKLPNNTDYTRETYIKLSSPFTQNYAINVLNGYQFNKIQMKLILLIGIFIGILFTMMINNFIIYIELRDKAYLYYLLYIFSMLIYQFTLLGIFKLILSKHLTAFLLSNTITISIIMMLFALKLLGCLFDIDKSFKNSKKYYNALIIMMIIGILIVIFGCKNIANYYAHFIALFGIVFMIFIGVKSYKNGMKQAKYFLSGWVVMLIASLVSVLRSIGFLPNNLYTVNVVLISSAIESIFLSAALADRIKQLNEEKTQALIMYKSAEEVSKANRTAFLQAQIKPHFLYNVLNIIATLCRIDAQKAREILLDLSNYFHHTFDFKNLNKYVSFEEELDFIKAYVRIEQARFRDKVNIIFDIDYKDDLKVPPLIIQPLIENAISHGIRKNEKGGTVILKVIDKKNFYYVEVSDNGKGMTEEELNRVRNADEETSGSVGLINIRKRLEILYGTSLNIESKLNEGTKVSFLLPKRKDMKNESDIDR